MDSQNDNGDIQVPLFVDLDGTLLKTDLLVESVFQFIRSSVLNLFRLLFWTLQGRVYLKGKVAQHIKPDPSTIPHNLGFLEFLEYEKRRGRTLYLATASDVSLARTVSAHFGLFSKVLASDGHTNLVSTKKMEAILEASRGVPFDYAGNSYVDLPIWRRARRSILVNPGIFAKMAANRFANVSQVFEDRQPALYLYLRAIRIHQWTKNLLIFIPFLTSHSWNNLASVPTLFTAFVSFCLSASAMYILNDLIDLPSDRRHPRKSARPLASGDLSLAKGIGIMAILLVVGLGLGVAVSLKFLIIILFYITLAACYSLYLKTLTLVDVIVLATLYTIRILAGTVTMGIVLSPWMFAFSMFLFLSLALVKRCSELKTMEQEERKKTIGRSYFVSDLSILNVMGVSSGYLAVLVLALFVNSPHDLAAYSHPDRLWLLCPPMAYWVSRLWIKTNRGEMHDDPLIFSAQDKVSWFIVGTMVAITFSAI